MTLTSLGLHYFRAVPSGSEAKTREQRLRRFIPYLAHYDGETLLTDDDQLVQIIKLEGLAFQTRDEEDLKRQKRADSCRGSRGSTFVALGLRRPPS